MNTDFDDLADRLAAIASDLDDRAFTLLREAAAEGRGRPEADKRLTQARRAVEKAERLLRGTTHSDDD
jgi:hypothetical protein